MSWFATALLCIIVVECVARIPLPAVISEMTIVVRKALHTLGSSSISDHWKEKVMLAYASSLFISTMKLAGLLLVVGTVAILLIFLFDYLGAGIGDFIASWAGIVFTIVAATAYFKIRKFFV